MYEHRHAPLMSRVEFAWRVVRHFGMAIGAVAVALSIGIVGYHFLAQMAWIDALLNASMILGGMGPVGEVRGDAAKLFASAYALFAGLFFIAISGLLLAPFLHRLAHTLHLEDEPKT